VIHAGDGRNSTDELRLADPRDPTGVDEARFALRRGADDFTDQRVPADEEAAGRRGGGGYG
jgi:hypothetical protein